ncbi:MAG TPA: theronine dehydrogenase, partial [Myxococcaceae bacterium]|nr:theronine dehydrogenase [Myxococcaceae bacterium]
MDATPYNAWKLVSLSPLPGLALALLGVAVGVGIALAGWGVLREPVLARRAVLWTLRILAGVAALFFLLEPGFRHLQVARVKSRLALLVDRSASMSFPVEA